MGASRGDRWGRWVALLALLAMVGMVLGGGWPLTYPLDDTYIHLSVARTLAEHGVWGLQASDPAAASSSPWFTVQLAAWAWAWPSALEWAPWALNAIALVATVFLWERWLAPNGLRGRLTFALALAVPLPAIAAIGMEHVQHVLAVTALVWVGATVVTDTSWRAVGVARLATLAALACWAVGVRYESLAVVAVLTGLLAWRGRWGAALAVSLAAALTVAAFGAWWVSQGGTWWPNALLIKSNLDVDASFAQRLALRLLNNLSSLSGAMVLIGALAAAAVLHPEVRRHAGPSRTDPLWALAVVAVAASAGQLAFGRVGWLYRYEAWLIALQALCVAMAVSRWPRPSGAAVGLAGLMAFALVRSVSVSDMVLEAPDDRRQEHLAPAQFVQRFYPTATVLANDVGLLAWLNPGARVIDLYGLAHNGVAQDRLRNGFGPDQAEQLAKQTGAALAIVQPCWLPIAHAVPDAWRLAEVWKVPRNRVFGDRLVAFFATNDQNLTDAKVHLYTFPVPKTIQVLRPETPGSPVHGVRAEDLRRPSTLAACAP